MSNVELYTSSELNACLNKVTQLAEGYYNEVQEHKEQVSFVRGIIIGALAGGHMEGREGASYSRSVLLQIADLLDIKIPDEVECEVLNAGSKEWGLVDRQTRRPVIREEQPS